MVSEPLDRRAFIASGLGFAACLAGTPWQALAASLTLRGIGGDMALITGAGGNVLAAKRGDHLVMVDSGTQDMVQALVQTVKSAFGAPADTTLFNTHWHLDHTGGNALLAERGASIIAHENTRLWMGMEFYVRWQDKTYQPRPEAARPTRSVFLDAEMTIGGATIRYGHLPRAHTDGDLYVHFVDDNIIATGDVVAVGAYPLIDYSTGGWIGELRDSTKMLLDMSNADTRFVPGRGPVVGRAHIQAQYDMLAMVYERMTQFIRQGMGADEMIANGIAEGFEEWGDPTLFMHHAYAGVHGHYRDMRIA